MKVYIVTANRRIFHLSIAKQNHLDLITKESGIKRCTLFSLPRLQLV